MTATVSTVLAGGFPGYSVGRSWSPGDFPGLQAEGKDRTMAFPGPHSGRHSWQPEAAVSGLNLIKQTVIKSPCKRLQNRQFVIYYE